MTRPETRRLTEQHYADIGQMSEALSRHADEILQQAGPEHVVEKVFRSLSEVDKQRRAIRRALSFSRTHRRDGQIRASRAHRRRPFSGRRIVLSSGHQSSASRNSSPIRRSTWATRRCCGGGSASAGIRAPFTANTAGAAYGSGSRTPPVKSFASCCASQVATARSASGAARRSWIWAGVYTFNGL